MLQLANPSEARTALPTQKCSRLNGNQQTGLAQQAAQFRYHRLVAHGDLRNHHVELVEAWGDQTGVSDGGVESADAYAEFLRMGKGMEAGHQGSGRNRGLRGAEAGAEQHNSLAHMRGGAGDALLHQGRPREKASIAMFSDGILATWEFEQRRGRCLNSQVA